MDLLLVMRERVQRQLADLQHTQRVYALCGVLACAAYGGALVCVPHRPDATLAAVPTVGDGGAALFLVFFAAAHAALLYGLQLKHRGNSVPHPAAAPATGAWWASFLLCSVVAFLAAVPLRSPALLAIAAVGHLVAYGVRRPRGAMAQA